MSTFNELIDFTRSTTGTYLDSVVYGDELVTNGDFATDSDWTKTGNLTAISNGTATIGETAGNGSIRQEDALIAGKSYIVKFDITAVSSASAFLAFRNDEFSSVGSAVISFGSSLSVATYSKVFVATGSIVNFTVGGGNSSLAIDNVSVKEVTGGQVSGTPLLRTAAINEPRLEYDASGNPLGLLIEEVRTNVVTYSEDFSQSYWLKQSVTVAPTSVAAPDGTTSAYEMDMASNGMVRALTGYVPSVGQSYTASIWLKAGTASTVKLSILFNGSGLGMVTENLTLTNKWQRFDITSTVPSGTPDQVRYRIIASEAGSILVWGAQVETGAFPTSYIPTSGSNVARAADVASLPVERFAYNQSKGTVVAFQETFGTTGNLVPWEIHTGDTNRIVYNAKSSTATIITGGSVQASLNHADQLPSVFYKQGLAFKKDDIASSLDASILTDTSGTIPTVSSFKIGTDYSLLAMLNGHIKHIQYYPKRLSNTELQLLTQPSASPTMNLTFDGQATSTLVEGLHD